MVNKEKKKSMEKRKYIYMVLELNCYPKKKKEKMMMIYY
jgi:hypothetical protein